MRKKEIKKKKLEKVTISLVVMALALSLFNSLQLTSINTESMTTGELSVRAVKDSIIPAGIPRVYGKELGIQYDYVGVNDPKLADKTISYLGNFDKVITLQGKDLERYIDITSQISCEYCCGAQSIIVRKEDVEDMDRRIEAAIASGQITAGDAEKYRKKAGGAACGCAHSYAMRGLAKYLITEHGEKFTDDEILEELGKWKTLFFPSQMTSKALVLEQKGIEFNYINLGSNKYREIESGAKSGSGMVGGC